MILPLIVTTEHVSLRETLEKVVEKEESAMNLFTVSLTRAGTSDWTVRSVVRLPTAPRLFGVLPTPASVSKVPGKRVT